MFMPQTKMLFGKLLKIGFVKELQVQITTIATYYLHSSPTLKYLNTNFLLYAYAYENEKSNNLHSNGV